MKRILLLISFILAVGLFALTKPAHAAVSDWQKGMSVYPWSQDAFSTENFRQSLRNLKTTGTEYVTFVIPFYQDTFSSSAMFAGNDTPTDASIAEGIRYAHSLGFKVVLKPHLEVKGIPDWRAHINPTNRTAWFSSYQSWIVRLAKVGQANNAEMIILGTELYSVTSPKVNSTNTTNWLKIISAVRSVFSGIVTYNAQFSGLTEANEIEFWDKLDYISLSAYFELATGVNNPTIAQLHSSWNYWKDRITPLQQKWGKQILFTEIGYRSLDGAHNYPFSSQINGAVDLEEQARDYEALFTFWKDVSYFKGVHLWVWYTDPNAGGVNNTDFTPQNKPAQETITKWFGGSGGVTPAPEPSATEYSISSTINPTQPVVNKNISISIKIKANGSLSGAIVDIEIYNSTNQKMYQKFYENQIFSKDIEKSYLLDWVPTSTGSYTIKVGIFSSNWAQAYIWNGSVQNFNVNNESQPTAPLSFIVSSTINQSEPKINQSLSITTNINSTQSLNNILVDIEVYNQSNQRVLQKFYSSQNLSANLAKDFGASFIPNSTGEYTIMIGIFNNNWSSNYYWNSNVKKFNVTNVIVTQQPANSGSLVIQNPVEGSSVVNGVFPLKALIEGKALNTYNMYWKVDGGQLNNMYETPTHKEAWIDVSGWWWSNNGPYKLTFVAKDFSGNTIAEKSVNITIAR